MSEKDRCFFVVQETKKQSLVLGREAGSVPPGYIKALHVQLLSQPRLSPGEKELGHCSLLPWIEISRQAMFTSAAILLRKDFSDFPARCLLAGSLTSTAHPCLEGHEQQCGRGAGDTACPLPFGVR